MADWEGPDDSANYFRPRLRVVFPLDALTLRGILGGLFLLIVLIVIELSSARLKDVLDISFSDVSGEVC